VIAQQGTGVQGLRATMLAKKVLNAAHGKLVFARRVRVLAAHLANELPRNAHMLDVGTGDGSIAALIKLLRPDVHVEGIDVSVRAEAKIPVGVFDGRKLPFPDRSFDVVTFVDVLHHTDDPGSLLREAARVARGFVVIKDHLREGAFARTTLKIMDWVGNAGHDVRLPYNYLNECEWRSLFAAAGLQPEHWSEHLGLYPLPVSWLLDRRLHFMARMPARADHCEGVFPGEFPQTAARLTRPLRSRPLPAGGR
jgi:SAM-dependent methyltransferase